MKQKLGRLEVIAGPMYCGKTEELIRLAKRAEYGKKKFQIFKHGIDNRYGKEKKLYSHSGITFKSQLVSSPQELLKKVKKSTEIVGIDEAQWFGENLIPVVETLVDQGKHLIVAGLAMTYDRQPFTPIPQLMAMADKVTKLTAVCMLCGNDAVYHKRVKAITDVNPLTADPSLVDTINEGFYQARCRNCYNK